MVEAEPTLSNATGNSNSVLKKEKKLHVCAFVCVSKQQCCITMAFFLLLLQPTNGIKIGVGVDCPPPQQCLALLLLTFVISKLLTIVTKMKSTLFAHRHTTANSFWKTPEENLINFQELKTSFAVDLNSKWP